MSRCGLLAVIALGLVVVQVRAETWSGSYVADGRCYCSGALDPALARRIVPTPVGGQSVASVCERIGTGPGPTTSGPRSGREVYTDPQCGHGPFQASAHDAECVDRKPANECRSTARTAGPRWDLERAYSRGALRAAEEVARQMGPTGVIGPPAVAPVLAAGLPFAHTVSIDGRRWQLAPPGTPEKGEPGSRIVLDGRLYLAVRDVAADMATRGVDDIVDVSLERLRMRRQTLMEQARERIRDRGTMRHAATVADGSAKVSSSSDSPTAPESARDVRPNP